MLNVKTLQIRYWYPIKDCPYEDGKVYDYSKRRDPYTSVSNLCGKMVADCLISGHTIAFRKCCQDPTKVWVLIDAKGKIFSQR